MARKAKKSAAQQAKDFRSREAKRQLTITPPEGVPLAFARASMGARFGAQFLDLVITFGALIALILIIAYSSLLDWDTAWALFALAAFLLRIPYYVLTELVWNGRTIGKRAAKIRVVSLNGQRLEPHQVVVRNVMKEAEVFTPIALIFSFSDVSFWVRAVMTVWLLVVIITPLLSKNRQRFGDKIAGTVVIEQPKLQMQAELTTSSMTSSDRFIFEPIHLEHYGRFELQSLEQILRETASSPTSYKRDVKVAETIRKKIGYFEPMQNAEARPFLAAFYAAQRAHLEARQIFGDRREDKFHADPMEPAKKPGSAERPSERH